MKESQTAFELMLFGSIEARVSGVSLQRALSARGKLLLAFLALSSGRPVATGVIADAVFPDSQAEDPHEIIKKTVQDIRHALAEEAYRLNSPAPRMLALDLDGAMCDWAIFHTALKENSREALQHAIAVHSRPFLEAENYPWVVAEQDRCLRLRQTALDTLCRQALDEGDLDAAASTLSQLIAFELPSVSVHEELWRRLLRILLIRQDFGIFHHLYTQLRSFLAHTAGRLPEPETQELYNRIPKSILIQIGQAKDKKRKSVLPDSARLPNFSFALLGRNEEMRRLKYAFEEYRLWTVTGLGGIGKTRFAVQVAQEIGVTNRMDVGFVDLTDSTQANLVQTLAATLGIKQNVQASLYDSVKDFLSPKRLLLVFDNCEHVIESAATLVAALLKDCPRLFLLATSRETLRVEGEQVFPLPPLDLPCVEGAPDSVPSLSAMDACIKTTSARLFVERAETARSGFRLSPQNAHVVAEICRLTEGIPLCIEMVASQAASFPLERIAEDLTDCILTLTHHKRGILHRHQTLQAALDWSYSILNWQEQSLMRRLAVFSGGWTREAAEGVCSDAEIRVEEISPLLADLVSKSLVVAVWSETGDPRFHLLETVRIYASEQSRLASERAGSQQRHRDYFAGLAEEADRQLSGKDQKQGLEILDIEIANLRSALESSAEIDAPTGLRLVYALSRYWEIRGRYSEGQSWADKLLAVTAASDPSVLRARVLDSAGWFRHIVGEYQNARLLLEESLEILQERGAWLDASVTLIKLGFAAVNGGNMPVARALFERSLAIRRELGDKRLIAVALINLGLAECELAEHAQARSLYEEALALLTEVGDQRMMANCLCSLGELAQLHTDYPRARTLFAESVAILRELGDKYLLRYALNSLANAQFSLEDYGPSRASYAECLELSIEANVLQHIMQCLEGLANIAVKQRHWKEGARLWGASEHLRESLHCLLIPWAASVHERLARETIAALGATEYLEALQEGHSLSKEAAYELARRAGNE